MKYFARCRRLAALPATRLDVTRGAPFGAQTYMQLAAAGAFAKGTFVPCQCSMQPYFSGLRCKFTTLIWNIQILCKYLRFINN